MSFSLRSEDNPLTRIVLITGLGLVIGALSSLAATLFVYAIGVLNDWLLISPRSRVMTDNAQWLVVATVCVPALGGLVVGLLQLLSPKRRPQGPPDIIRTVQENIQHIGHFHTAGNPGRFDMDDTQEMNYVGICKGIAAAGYEYYVGHEFNPRGNKVEALAKAFALCDQG